MTAALEVMPLANTRRLLHRDSFCAKNGVVGESQGSGCPDKYMVEDQSLQ
jgi:hypothetical protein